LALTSTAGTPSILLQDITNDTSFLYTVAANLTAPILDGGRISGNIKSAKARRDAAAAVYAQQVLTAFREVENTLSNEATLVARERLQEKALGELREAYRIATIRYKSGQIDIVSLLQAQRSMLASESVLLSTRLARLNNRIDLFLALGESVGERTSAMRFRDEARLLPLPNT
jgi:outer membrane protein TolC